jgi:ribulose-5-phosphate 4-epimerase/fuculose-1-phosphate aldolase
LNGTKKLKIRLQTKFLFGMIRELVCELCRQFFTAGWVTGTGGSISIKDLTTGNIYMTPSGVQKERIQPDELFVLDIEGKILSSPVKKDGGNQPKLSDCAPLFFHAFRQRQAGKALFLV